MELMKKEDLYLLNNSQSSFDIKNICERAKELLIDHSMKFNDICDYYEYFNELNYIKSPIEQIFYVSYILYCKLFNKYKVNDVNLDYILLEEIKQQKILIINDKKYLLDFVIDFSRKTILGNYIYPKLKKLKYAIEIDGFDYHSNKQQMNYDYERENNLKINGYNVIRFTGSQIYKEPYTCIDKLINIIINDIKKELI